MPKNARAKSGAGTKLVAVRKYIGVDQFMWNIDDREFSDRQTERHGEMSA